MTDRTAENEAVGRWQEAGEKRDVTRLEGFLAEDVELVSPLTERFRFRGREQVTELLDCAYEVLEDVRFHTELSDGATAALFMHARCRAQVVEEAQLLRLRDGRIHEITLFGRPLPGVTAIMSVIGPSMSRRQGRPAVARLLQVATAPLAAAARLGDRGLVPLVDPSRGRRR